MAADPTAIALAIVAGAVYGTVWYARAYQSDGEAFDPWKFGATLLVAALVGAALGAEGTVTRESIEVQLGVYAGVITIVEAVLKIWYDVGVEYFG